jgi:two-component system NtrC family response regulator
MATVLIVDADRAVREALEESIASLGYRTRAVAFGAEALAFLSRERVDAMLLDLRTPDLGGLEVLERIRALDAPPPVAVMSAPATAASSVEAMRLGASDHLTKPIGLEDLSRVLKLMLASAAARAHASPPEARDTLVGSSEPMRAVQKMIGLLADSDATVLITGETGTGKELVARALHQSGCRARHAFVAVNCAATPADLLESELFGHVRGAFTGATSDRAGAVRLADRGTLFLDEIGDMDLTMQAKILRVLQRRVVLPVGGGAETSVDVRVIAATHRDLAQKVEEGSFREDLFYRLHVVPIHLPPLRERMADIVALAQHFLAAAGEGKRLTADAAARLLQHRWPGNVRELKNAMERTAALTRGAVITAADLNFLGEVSFGTASVGWPDEDLPSAAARLEELLIRRALQRAGGNRAEAARILNINRQLLYSKLKRYGLEASENVTPSVVPADSARDFHSAGPS